MAKESKTEVEGRIENWLFLSGRMIGVLEGNPNHPKGIDVVTSYVERFDFDKKVIETNNSVYRLGEPHDHRKAIEEACR